MDYAVLIIAYLLGSIPFGLLFTKMSGHGDIRQIGSGNIGATNVLRTGNKKIAALTLFCDMLKGTVATYLALFIAPPFAAYAGILALLGHMFPVWLKFKGGKGVATALGVMIALAPPVAVMALLVWLASALIMRISSFSALAAFITMPIFVDIFQYDTLQGAVLVMMGLIIYKHMNNITRMLDGKEPHIGQKDKNEPKKADTE